MREKIRVQSRVNLAWVVVGSLSVVSCGEAKKEVERATGLVSFTPQQKSDVEEQTANQLQDAVDAVSAVDAGGVALGLDDTGASDRSPTRTCVKDSDTQVTVTNTSNWNEEGSKAGGQLTRTFTKTVDSTITNIWSRAPDATEALDCTAGNTVKVRWLQAAEVNGLALNVTGNKTHSVNVTWSGTRRNGQAVTLDLNRTFVANGSRSISHGDHAYADGTSLSFVRTITSDVKRTLSGTRRKKDGLPTETETFSLEHQVVVSGEAPLKVKTEFDLSAGLSGTRTWSQKTIQSGTVSSSSDESATRIVSKFNNVVFTAGECIPTSGTITGSIFPKEPADAEATDTFTITFGDASADSGVSLSLNEGEAADFPAVEEQLEGCEFSKLLKIKP